MAGLPAAPAPHGGNRLAIAHRLGCRPDDLLEASASLVPFGPPAPLRRSLRGALGGGLPWFGGSLAVLRDYPDRDYSALRQVIARHHGLDPAAVLPGNGAAELFTWAARDAAATGLSLLPSPGFADYRRALACWGGSWRALPLPLHWERAFPQPFAAPALAAPASAAGPAAEEASVLWLTNPHNPSGQLWSRASLEPLLARFDLVIADEAFLPLVSGGEAHSLVPLLAHHPNLVVIRSLTKLYGMAGLRLGYAVAQPERLQRWAQWRDPWPVNAVASAVGQALLRHPGRYRAWMRRVQSWTAQEGTWLTQQLRALPGLVPMPSAANYVLIRGERNGAPCSLQPLRQALEARHRILLRDCRSFEGLDNSWLRIGYQSRRGNRRIIRAMRKELHALRG